MISPPSFEDGRRRRYLLPPYLHLRTLDYERGDLDSEDSHEENDNFEWGKYEGFNVFKPWDGESKPWNLRVLVNMFRQT